METLAGNNSVDPAADPLFPQHKKATQGTQLMNLLFRPVMGPLVHKLYQAGLRADLLTLVGIGAYLVGAFLICQASSISMAWGIGLILAGLIAELLDGSLARLGGPSPLGHFVSQLQAEFYVLLLLPSLSIGLYRANEREFDLWGLLAVGVFGALAEIATRNTIEKITVAHPAEKLYAIASTRPGKAKMFFLAQLLPEHPHFTTAQKAARIVRENLCYSSGLQPLLLLAAFLFDALPAYVWFYGALNLLIYGAMTVAKAALLIRGGGRIL